MASVNFTLKNPKKDGQLRKDECRIIARFAVDRDHRFAITTEESIRPKDWNTKSQQAKASAPDHIHINLYLSNFKRDLITLYRENRNLAFQEFKDLARNPQKKSELPIEAYLQYIEKEKSGKTLKSYRKAMEILKPFAGQEISIKLYDRIKSHLYQQGLIDSTVYKYLKIIKNFLNWAIKRGLEANVNDWEIIDRENEVITLDQHELEALEKVELSGILDIARDYLVAECRTGQRISDIKAFDIQDYENYVWTITQKKGRRLNPSRVQIPLNGYCSQFLYILSKYNYKMPVISEQKINKHLKTVCEKAGINQWTKKVQWIGGKEVITEGPKHNFISTHTGRKTFITLALQYLPHKIVMNIAGIKSYKTLKRYDGKSDLKVLQQSMDDMAAKMKVA